MLKNLSSVKFVEIPGYNGLYLISEFGNIFNTKTRKYITPYRNKRKIALRLNLCYNGNVTGHGLDTLIEQSFKDGQ